MDEIIIGDKKYISSKQAAKATGYAKDYIGQLCREGRVPARLVGRSWYVLESAIHDHRFGDQKIEKNAKIASVEERLPKGNVLSPTWESPRYEASSTEEVLPSVNRLVHADVEEVQEDDSSVAKHLQDSWKAWFERVEDIEPVTLSSLTVAADTQQEEIQEAEEEEKPKQDDSVNVPVHAVYRKPPEELLPRHSTAELEPGFQEVAAGEQRGNRGVLKIMQMSGALIALLMVILAALGSGYFDTYIISVRQVGIIAGIAAYNK